MKPPITHRADERPRIYVRHQTGGASFSYGHNGRLHFAPSVGEAFERAVGAIEGRDAVVIYEGIR